MRRWLSWLLAFCMTLTLLPCAALATEPADTAEEEEEEEIVFVESAADDEEGEAEAVEEPGEVSGDEEKEYYYRSNGKDFSGNIREESGVGSALLAAANDRGDTYPDKYKNPARDTVIDEWNFYNRECTSFVAWCLNSRNGVAFHNWMGGQRWGNAKDWGTTARNLGYTVDSSPAVGSVAWSNAGYYGHVAWVSGVSGNNITIEEYNYNYNLNSGGKYSTH